MTTIKHKPLKQKNGDFNNHYEVLTNNIDDCLNEMLPRIRLSSRNFYTKNIKDELENKGSAIIDQHAGNGIFYSIKMEITQ